MKEIKFNELVTFLVANMISVKVETTIPGIVIVFIDAEKDKEICKYLILIPIDIKTVKDVLMWLCEHPKCLQTIKNDILKYRLNHEPMYLLTYSDTTWIFSKHNEERCRDIMIKIINSIFSLDSYIDDEPHNPNIDYIEFILTKLTRRDILEQLAEEASELAEVSNRISICANDLGKSAIKLIRSTEDTNNVTPMECKDVVRDINVVAYSISNHRTTKLEEECGDVNMCLDLLHHIDDGEPIYNFHTLDNPKWKRWAERLGFINF